MLLQIRDYIQREKYVSTEQLARTFNIEFSALEPMLDRLILCGRIMVNEIKDCRQVCNQCNGGGVRKIYHATC